jgi:hypothetical protein
MFGDPVREEIQFAKYDHLMVFFLFGGKSLDGGRFAGCWTSIAGTKALREFRCHFLGDIRPRRPAIWMHDPWNNPSRHSFGPERVA